MSEFSHYEADQSALYSGGHHQDASSVESKGKVKKIWMVTGILTIVTIVEVGLGLYGHSVGMPKSMINTFFILLTLFKAGYIVKVFIICIIYYYNIIQVQWTWWQFRILIKLFPFLEWCLLHYIIC